MKCYFVKIMILISGVTFLRGFSSRCDLEDYSSGSNDNYNPDDNELVLSSYSEDGGNNNIPIHI